MSAYRNPRNDRLSVTMAVALAETLDHGGVLVYWRGGWWTYPGCPVGSITPDGYRVPAWFVRSHTIQGLIRRDHAKVIERAPRRSGRSEYPIKVQLFAERQEADDGC